MTTVGLVHPGEMGAALGSVLRRAGHDVLYARDGRSAESVARATAAGLTAVASVEELARSCDLVLSVVPPHAAEETARRVAPVARVLVDANAVSPGTARRIAGLATAAGCAFVDGGIVGPPPVASGTTRLYLAGAGADDVATLFAGSVLEAVVVGEDVGAASALKMSYAAWSKGTDALLLAAVAAARANGVEEALLAEWRRSKPEVLGLLPLAGSSAARKGWRWVGEMEEIAETLAAAGLPAGFHEAAAEVFRRSAREAEAPDGSDALSRVVDGLLGRAGHLDRPGSGEP
jgi:3-hydroxyisobutyrate dehydrogenase-like beta-hydroxyacid dehydrogenase